MKVAFATIFDARDVKNWSGTYLHMWKAIEAQGAEVTIVDNLVHGRSISRRARKFWGTKIERREFMHFWDRATARAYGADVALRLRDTGADVVVSPSPVPLAFLNTPIPKVLWTDAAFSALNSDHAEFSSDRICSFSLRHGLAIDRAVIRNCDLLLFAGQWGADAILKAGADPKCTAVIPYGANIGQFESIPGIGDVAERPNGEEIQLLFVGVDWVRKGAGKAIDVARCLHRRGVNVTLKMIGCFPPAGYEVPPYVELLGFVSKETAQGRATIAELYRQSHFLIVPTIAEAYGVVFAEASAFGVPSLSHRVGGVQTIVRDDVNGRLFELNSAADEWAQWIVEVRNTPRRMQALAQSSRREYRDRLNWDVAGRDAVALIRRVVEQSRSGAQREEEPRESIGSRQARQA